MLLFSRLGLNKSASMGRSLEVYDVLEFRGKVCLSLLLEVRTKSSSEAKYIGGLMLCENKI